MSGTDHVFFCDDALLILDEDKKISACSGPFLSLFGLAGAPVGVSFDDLFETESGFKDIAGWRPFSCTLRSGGITAHGMMNCENDRFRIVLSRMQEAKEAHRIDMGDTHLAALFSKMDEGVAIHRLVTKNGKAADYIIEDLNESFAELFGLERSTAAGQSACTVFGTIKAPFIKKFDEALRAGKPTQFDVFYAGTGAHYLISVTPFCEYRFGTIVSDLSKSRHSQLLYKALNEAAAVISGTVETETIFLSAAQILKKYGFECMMLPLDDDGVMTKMHLSFGDRQIVRDQEQIFPEDTVYDKLVEQRRAVYIESLDIPPQLMETGLSKDMKCIASPLVVGGALAGHFVILSRGLKQSDMEAVTAFANQIAAMMEKAALISSLRTHIRELEASKIELGNVAERLKMASRASRVGVWDIDLVRNVEYMDNALQKIYGLEPGTFDGTLASWQKFVHPDDKERVSESYRESLRTGGDYAAEYRIVLQDGTVRHISSSGVVYRDDMGKPVRMVGTDWDITERKEVELALMSEKELLKTTLQSIGDAVMVTDSQGCITLANDQFARLCGSRVKYINGRSFSEVANGVYRQDGSQCRIPDKTLYTGRVMTAADSELVRKDAKTVPVAYTVAPIMDGEDAVCGSVLVMRNITEEKKRQKKLDFLVFNDALTGVYNRRYFDLMARKLDKPSNLPLSVLSCDVNGLKLTNDAFGHNEGDKLLKRMASIMTKVSRPGDIVARVGGDEFLILMPRADEREAEQACERIKALAAKNRTLAIDESLSVGCETKTQPEESLRAVINRAEISMYRNKTHESPKMKESTIKSIMMTLYERYPYQREHIARVTRISCDIAKNMGLGKRELDDIKTLTMMSDIGKIAVDQSVLDKQGDLTDEDWKQIKRHPEVGFRILIAFNEMAHIAGSVLSLHERYDGEGYPNGISGDQIPLLSRIVAVAAAYDTMITERPYRRALSHRKALKEIVANKGTQFDPVVVDEFLRVIDN